jgi:hypothetical protein
VTDQKLLASKLTVAIGILANPGKIAKSARLDHLWIYIDRAKDPN